MITSTALLPITALLGSRMCTRRVPAGQGADEKAKPGVSAKEQKVLVVQSSATGALQV